MNYSIAQAAKEMNLTTYTLRYYDREGLLSNVKRDKSGKRIFTKDDMEMLSLICCLKKYWNAYQGNKTIHRLAK